MFSLTDNPNLIRSVRMKASQRPHILLVSVLECFQVGQLGFVKTGWLVVQKKGGIIDVRGF